MKILTQFDQQRYQVRDLRAAWEPKPPVSAKPEPRERRSRKEVERTSSSKVLISMIVVILMVMVDWMGPW